VTAVRVLVVDDEPQLVRALRINLERRGYEVHAAATGTQALELAATVRPDVVLLDLGLPDIDGTVVIDGLRGWTRMPIIVLSARQGSSDKVLALDAGADDYITKPFSMDELLARLRAAVRRAEPVDEPPVVLTADFTVDLVRRQVSLSPDRGGEVVHLTPTEWHLLEVLARYAGRLVTHRELLHEVWGPGYDTESHYLRLYVSQLRGKLEATPTTPRSLLTELGLGYRLREATTPASPGAPSGAARR